MRLRHLIPAALLAFATLSARADVNFIANPCGLLTEQDVSAIVGAPAKIGMKMDAAGMCGYKGADGQSVFVLRGTVYGNGHDSNESYDSLARVVPPKSVETLSGIGDKAEIVTSSAGDIILYILKGPKLIMLSLTHGPATLPARKPALTQAARQLAGRL